MGERHSELAHPFVFVVVSHDGAMLLAGYLQGGPAETHASCVGGSVSVVQLLAAVPKAVLDGRIDEFDEACPTVEINLEDLDEIDD